MADESDVEAALVAAAASAIYPSGISSPPVGGYPCRIGSGQPNAAALDSDLLAGVANVCVTLVPYMSRKATRYLGGWNTGSIVAPPLAVTVSGAVATFTGAGGAGALVGVRSQGIAYVYATLAADTPATVAAALAAMIPAATASGAVLTLAAMGSNPSAAIVGFTPAIMELRRQEQAFAIDVLASTPAARTAVASTVDAALAAIDFLTLADGSGGRLLWRRTKIDDVPQRSNLWRREMIYTVEFGTTAVQQAAGVLFNLLNLNGLPVVTQGAPNLLTVGGQNITVGGVAITLNGQPVLGGA